MAWTDRPNYRRLPKSKKDWVRRRDDYTCTLCGQPGREVDHILNQAQGGTDQVENLRVLCTHCHNQKTKQEAAVGRSKRSPRRQPLRHPALS